MSSKDIEAGFIMRKSTHEERAPHHLTQCSVYTVLHSDFFITVCLGGKVSTARMWQEHISRPSRALSVHRAVDGAQLCSSLLVGTGGCCWLKPNLLAIKEPFDHIVFTGAFFWTNQRPPWQRGWGEVYNRITFVCNLFLIDANKPVN